MGNTRREYNGTTKKKMVKSKNRHERRSTWKIDKPTIATCKHCHEPVLPHRVCSNCGYYDGKEIIAKSEEK